jgi:hypothetical protein
MALLSSVLGELEEVQKQVIDANLLLSNAKTKLTFGASLVTEQYVAVDDVLSYQREFRILLEKRTINLFVHLNSMCLFLFSPVTQELCVELDAQLGMELFDKTKTKTRNSLI